MIRGVTFDKQLNKSEDDAHRMHYFFQGQMGVTKGCNITEDANGDLVVSDGYFDIYGRLVANVGDTIVEVPNVPSGTLYSILVFEVDLSQENTIDTFNQGKFKIVSDSVDYPELIQDDLDNGGTIYQMEFCRFENTVSGIVNLVDNRPILDLQKYATQMEFDEHKADYDKHLLNEGWINATMLNGWATYQSGTPGFGRAQYRKLSNNLIQIRGNVRDGAIGQPVFNLPVGYRPSRNVYETVIQSSFALSSAVVDIDGDFIIRSGTNNYVLFGLIFSID